MYTENFQGLFNIQVQQHCQHPLWSSQKGFSSIKHMWYMQAPLWSHSALYTDWWLTGCCISSEECEPVNPVNKTLEAPERPGWNDGWGETGSLVFNHQHGLRASSGSPLPPEHITGGPCGLIKIKEITCKDQRKRAGPSSKRLDSQGITLWGSATGEHMDKASNR